MATVSPKMVFVTPALNENTCTELLPLTVRRFVPGPAMITLEVIGGSGEASAIVPLVLNTMVLPPGVALASRIAWRSDPGPELSVVETVRVVASVVANARPKKVANRTLSLI